jgi:hypothetical protein
VRNEVERGNLESLLAEARCYRMLSGLLHRSAPRNDCMTVVDGVEQIKTESRALRSKIQTPAYAVTAVILNRGSRLVASTRSTRYNWQDPKIRSRAHEPNSEASLRQAHWFKEIFNRHERRRSSLILRFPGDARRRKREIEFRLQREQA